MTTKTALFAVPRLNPDTIDFGSLTAELDAFIARWESAGWQFVSMTPILSGRHAWEEPKALLIVFRDS